MTSSGKNGLNIRINASPEWELFNHDYLLKYHILHFAFIGKTVNKSITI